MKNMTTKEMVAEYNLLTGKSIKKFSTRGAGEKQLAAARKANAPAAREANAPAARPTVVAPTKSSAKLPSSTRSASTAESWLDKSVVAARKERTAVRAKGIAPNGKAADEEFGSVRKAFSALGLPDCKHGTFRLILKANGKAKFRDLNFSVVKG
jgi:hypothetical protein